MKHIDITFDFETAALCPTAAPLSLGAVAWDRNAKESPFLDDLLYDAKIPSDFFVNIDLASGFVAGLTIDTQTQEWWKMQSQKAKDALLIQPKRSLKAAIQDFFTWIEDIQKTVGAETVCLWCQGSDFDIAILRNICYVMNIDIPVRYTNFRDHRSVCMEFAAKVLEEPNTDACIPARDPKKAYALVDEYKVPSSLEEGWAGACVAHTPVFDCRKSIYSTWQLMRQL